MLTPILLAVALGASPAEALSVRFPGSVVVRSADGQRVTHASGFRAETRVADAEGAARAFLGAHAAAFGITSRQSLALASKPPARGVRAVRFRRTIDGLPVFGGDLVVGVDAASRVYVVNGADVPPATSGRHVLGEEAARRAAMATLRGARAAKPPTVAAGWSPYASGVRAVYRVDLVTADHEWRLTVDAETGRVLFRVDRRLRATAPGRIYQVSPTETWSGVCPLAGTARTYCAAPVDATLENLATGSDLAGAQTSVYNCNGQNPPLDASAVPGACVPVLASEGSFAFQHDASFRSTSDAFAAANAYFHVDRHLGFLKSLDGALPDGTTGRALTASLPAFVNAYYAGAPLENAYYSGDLDGLVLGQGAWGDFAYDATVAYHELTHAAIEAWGGYASGIDELGGLDEPGALHEGTADAMAAAETGRSEMASFVSAFEEGTRCLRDVSDPYALRTCKGHGNNVPQFGLSAIDGLDGEVHDDGEIWSGFFWEVYRGLEVAGVRGCGGACPAAAAIQYETIQLAAGNRPTFASYWQTFHAAAASLFPERPEVAAFVECVARRRELDQCDRTVPVYRGELKAVFSRLPYSPLQIVFHATGPAQYAVCSGLDKTAVTLHVRSGAPVQVNGSDVIATQSVQVPPCEGYFPHAWIGIPSAGTWYLLFDWPGVVDDPDGYDLYLVQASAGAYGIQSRPASAAPDFCAAPFAQALAIAPGTASVAPNGTLAFTASGGTGTGFVWTLAANRSGATIDATGAYRAGATGAVTDVVRVTDSYGDAATRDVAVTGTPPPAPSRGGGGCATADGGLLAAAGVVAAAARRRRRAR